MGLYRSPSIALGINIGIDFLGALPTIRKSLRHSDGENLLAWLLCSVANALNLLAIVGAASVKENYWTWQIVIYPIYIFLVTSTIFLLLWRGQRNRYRSI
ncbi:hypothetical protein [Chamaesiphon polymorphus]|nr:hypothetical protein [Chamaesiphon polymorphus]